MTHHVGRIGTTTAIAFVPILLACDSTPTVCDASFLAVSVTIVDTLGNPVPQAGVTSVLARTGDTLLASPVGISVGGTYAILTDQALPRIRHRGDTIDVTLDVPPTQRTLPYFFDSPQGCHVRKVSGPDTIAIP